MTYTTAHVWRTEMCGGGTSYDVLFRTKDKPSHPLHGGYYYCTIVCRDGGEYFEVIDAIDPKSHWTMGFGWDKYETSKRLAKIADRLAVRIAARVFPELKGLRRIPSLWADWTLPSEHKTCRVRLTLPE